MNKTAIKNFAIWARNKLIADISYRAGLMGITADGIHSTLPQSTGQTEFYDIGTAEPYAITGEAIRQRKHLVERIRQKEKDTDYKTAYKYIIEEVAYTWFNRLIAVRFMEVNDYLPSHIRVLSSDTGKLEPDLVTTPFDAELEFTRDEQQTVLDLKNANKLDEVFRLLFIKQCNALNEILPALFEKTNDYTELLLNLSVIDQDGVVYHLVHDIPEEDFDVERGGQVEIIGWLYQYYNTELNEQVYDGNMSKSRISKALLPAATTIFTPDWPVRYMVENSLGRLWLEGHPNEELKADLKYYLDEASQSIIVNSQLEEIRESYQWIKPEDIRLLDPCMGSGHILVYAFDLMMKIYESAGYGQRDAAKSILEHNLFGLDIDDRAFQIAYFAVMMKARQYNRRILNEKCKPNLYSISESNEINREQLKYFGRDMSESEVKIAISQINELLDTFIDAKEYGSILLVNKYNWDLLRNYMSSIQRVGQLSFETINLEETAERIISIINQASIMSDQYDVVITNPPYLGASRFSPKLDSYVKMHYPDVKSDLSIVMLKAALERYSRKKGFVSFITTSSWFFISSFEKMRDYVLDNYCFSSIVDFGTELFEGKVGHNPIVAWVNRNAAIDCDLIAVRLVDYCYSRRDEKEPQFFNTNNYYVANSGDFEKIPGAPIAYWVSSNFADDYAYDPIGNSAEVITGMTIGDNNKYLRLWFEVDKRSIAFGKDSMNEIDLSKTKWIPYSKGGPRRNWYGNYEYVVNWTQKDNFNRSKTTLQRLYLRPALTWPFVTSGVFSARILPKGFLWDVAGSPCFFTDDSLKKYTLGLLCSNVANYILKVVNPTINVQAVDIARIPLIVSESDKEEVIRLVDSNIEISKAEWDSFEYSWDFRKHPFIGNGSLIKDCFQTWSNACDERFLNLKSNEMRLNSIFIRIYGLDNDLSSDVPDEMVTVRKADKTRDVKSLLSYAVGCLLGRYSLEREGVMDSFSDMSAYGIFSPDEDNIIPITDEEYLEDDIVSRFCEWLKAVFGVSTLEENLDYIASVLNTKGDSSREVIRNYFLESFFKDHCASYAASTSGKRPIYWLFDSGKQNGFKALIYLHRYNADTIGNLRIDYLHRMQRVYESEIGRMQDMIDHSTNAREVGQATKRKDKLTKQLKECREYDEKLAHLALSRIELDLDDGVKVNYRKIQTANDGKFYEVLADSKNIMAKK